MWTRFVASAVAHDINNLAQGLLNMGALAAAPDVSPEERSRYTQLAREGLEQLQQLARNLKALSAAGAETEPQRLDVVCAETVAQMAAAGGPALELAGPAAPILVAASRPVLQLVATTFVRYAAAMSATAPPIRIGVTSKGDAASLVIDAPTAPNRAPVEQPLVSLMGAVERGFGGDAGLAVAGAAVALCGGEARVGPAPGGGLRFKLSFRRVGAA